VGTIVGVAVGAVDVGHWVGNSVGEAVGGDVHAWQLAGHWLRCCSEQCKTPVCACALQFAESTIPKQWTRVGADVGAAVVGASVVGCGVATQNAEQWPGHCCPNMLPLLSGSVQPGNGRV
jgi:hypothetical protein